MEDKFEKDLKEWAEGAVKYCHDIATNPDENQRVNKAFYAFQSKPVKNPEVLILGINPGDNSDYEGQYTNYKVWGKEVEENKGMTAKRFLEENHYWNDHENWTIWKNLKKVFQSSKMKSILSTDNFVYMNALYFNTNNMNDFYKLPNANEVFKRSIELTKEAVKIINPQRIICLSIPECFNRLNDGESELLLSNKINLLVKGKFCGIPTYGIPHTSNNRKNQISSEDWSHIGFLLHNEFYNEDLLKMDSYIACIEQILETIAKENNLTFAFTATPLSRQYGRFDFSCKEIDWITICFEFRSPFYRDLHYGFRINNKDKFNNTEDNLNILGYKGNKKFYNNWGWIDYMQCDKYSDWVLEKERFDENEFREYFNQLIDSMKEKINRLYKVK